MVKDNLTNSYMEPILSYEQGSETIRQLPQNYCIATKQKGYWMIDFDLAADINLVLRVTEALATYEARYSTGLELLAKVTPNSEHDNQCLDCGGTGVCGKIEYCVTCNGRGYFK